MTNKGYIYGLIDPRTNKIRYIGKTTNLKSRIWDHLNNIDGNIPKKCWIRKLISLSLKPKVKVLKICSIKSLNKEEIKYIKKYRKNLLNVTKGGDGWEKGKKANKKMLVNLRNLHKIHQKPIYGIRLLDKKIKYFSGIIKASNCLKINVDNIWQVLNGKLDYTRGWYFHYTNKKRVLPKYSQRYRLKRIPIYGINILNNKKITFSSKTEAKEKGFYIKGIDDCLNNKRRHSQGYRWFYGK